MFSDGSTNDLYLHALIAHTYNLDVPFYQVFMAQEAKYAAAIIYLKDSETPLVMSGRQGMNRTKLCFIL